MLFVSFWNRSIGTFKLAIQSQIEYRLNLFTDAVLQPILVGVVEVSLWQAIFTVTGRGAIAGYSRESYLAYALWAAFFARIAANWMFEFRMIDEIDTGNINSILARPISFYEYYLGQYLGYKSLTGLMSLVVPVVVMAIISSHPRLERLPLALLLALYYVILGHTISFTVASLGFFFNRVHALSVAKNITLGIVCGELFPLDLVPEPFRGWLLAMPFSSGVFLPVGYLTGRVDAAAMGKGFLSVTAGLVVFGALAFVTWNAGRRRYVGTGA
jgi:ABC-2 type transport system permease protein